VFLAFSGFTKQAKAGNNTFVTLKRLKKRNKAQNNRKNDKNFVIPACF